jgi:hypothetical protein
VDGGDTSKIFNLTLNGNGANPTVTISTPSPEICAGAPTTFTATAANAGNNPSYQWQVNGVNVGTNSNTYTTTTLQTNNEVKVIMTGTSACAASVTVTSNVLGVWVNPSVVPSVTIAPSSADACKGSPVTFTATPVNGGLAPVYQWQKNGVDVGTNSAAYTDNTLVTGDKVQAILTSNAFCAVPAIDTSNIITAIIHDIVAPTITISGNTTADFNEPVILTAVVTRGGATPSYQWQDSTQLHGWMDMYQFTTPSITYYPMTTGDKVRCRLTSNDPCVSTTNVWSNDLAFTVNTTGGRIVANPVTTTLIIDGLMASDDWEVLEIMSVSNGNKVMTVNIARQSTVRIPVSQLPNGLYVAVLISSNGNRKYLRFLKM